MHTFSFFVGGIIVLMSWIAIFLTSHDVEKDFRIVRAVFDFGPFRFAFITQGIGLTIFWFGVVNLFKFSLIVFLGALTLGNLVCFFRYARKVYRTKPVVKQNTGYIVH